MLAHGVGGRSDLPLPLWLAAYGAALALLISFVALRILWPRPLLARLSVSGAVPSPLQALRRPAHLVLRVVGLALFALTLSASIVGSDQTVANVAPYAVCVVFWVGVALASAIVGDVFRAANPFDTIAIALRIPEATGRPDPGAWPGAVMLLSFAWLELAYHEGCGDPRALAWWLSGYSVAALVGARVWGRSWLRTGEGFAALLGLFARLAPLHWDAVSGRLRLRAPLSGLASVRETTGTLAVVVVALGSTTFDGFTRSQIWNDIVGQRIGWDRTVVSTVGLLWVIGVVAGCWLAVTRVTARMLDRDPTEIATMFVASLVPIALGYAVAHYFSLLVFDGQSFLVLLSDPFARGWDVFGTTDHLIDYRLVSARTIAYVQVASIVVGHIAGVVVAHDRAVEAFEPRDATRSQYPLLAVMILYTVAGLLLLLGG